jgi:hypothetical protein
MNNAQVPTKVRDYLVATTAEYQPGDHPTIAQTFRPDCGWKRYPMQKRITRSWARKLRAEGVTHLALAYRGRMIDFCIEDVTR